ncbi:MAG: SGNH/GDSL hydrolase family protein, partial [Ferruginibacter sp.]
MRKIVFLILLCIVFHFCVNAQLVSVPWDDVNQKKWGAEFSLVHIKSSGDSSVQNAWFYKSKKNILQPLIISLHTWSGDYNQEDPLAKEILLRDWNYIHPDFRGANNNPKACGSSLVITDLEDAINFSIKNANVDTSNVHIIGVSGGGYAAMLAYMKINYPVKSFNAWVGISNLTEWYWESKGRNAKYATDVEQVAMNNGEMNWRELDLRSPIKLPFSGNKRKNTSLHIYAGVHDGYTGSVPVSHSINMYNKIASALYPGQNQLQVADKILISLLAKQLNPAADTLLKLGGRVIQLDKKTSGVSLTIFEGGHEMLVPQALALLSADKNKNFEALNILTLGDSNGTFDFGWPQQMKKLLPYATIINKSVSGNTIGFDNLGKTSLNTLASINEYLDDAFRSLGTKGKLDYVFINLGTNDTKIIFKDRQKEVANNLTALLQKIKNYLKAHGNRDSRICFITPSPMDEQKIDRVKYGGGNLRIQENNLQFKKIIATAGIDFLNSYDTLK